MKPRVMLLAAAGLMLAALFAGSQAYAAPRQSFTMQIVPPECTIDTVDDGGGPVQVVTCPPGTVDPENPEQPPVSEPGEEPDGSTPPQPVVRRIYSPSDLVDLFGPIKKPAPSSNVSEQPAVDLPATTDIVQTTGSVAFWGGTAGKIATVLAAAGGLGAAMLLFFPRVRNYLLQLFRRK